MATIDGDSGQSRKDPWQVYAYLVNQIWLRSAFNAIREFLHILIPAQAMILGGELLMTVVSKLALAQMNAPSIGFGNLAMAGLYLLLGLVLGAPLLLYGFARMIFRLTAFCRFWLMKDHLKADSTEDWKAMSSEALNQLSKHAKFLGKYWFYCSLLLILPIVLGLVLLYIKIEMAGNADFFAFRSTNELIVIALLAIVVVYIIAASALMFPVSAMQDSSPGRAALSTFAMSFRLFLPCLPICIFVVLLNAATSSPEFLLKQVVGSAAINDNLLFSLILLVWQAAIGLLLLPASMLPFCELWKTTRHESN
jgi:hypothetical protein